MSFRPIPPLLLALSMLLSTARAQHGEVGSPQAADASTPNNAVLTIHTAVSEVHLVFTVTDKHGHYIRDLKQSDFEILDDRKPPEKILSFRSETDLPLEIGLLIDTSQSVRERFQFEQQAALEFLNQVLRPEYDQAFVMGFSMYSEITQDLTADNERLSVGIHKLRPGNLTAMYDALYHACRDKLMRQAQKEPVRRIIILLSDGDDNTSSVTRERAIEMAQRAEVSVYTISTSLNRSGKRGQKNLERIANATGGRSYIPIQITELTNSFAAIQEELRSQYAVSYKPAAFRLDGHYRTIDIQARAKKDLRIRSRKGYRSTAND